MNLNKAKLSKAILASGLILALGCKNESNRGNDGNGDATKYILGITKPTNGTLSSNAGGINCGSKGSDCEAEFSKGTKVTLTATADTGYAPGAWQGACDKTKADQACKLTMDANKTAGRAFLVKHTLSITKPTNGTLVSDPVGINCGSKGNDCEVGFGKGTGVTLTAMANTGYVLGDWQGDCDKTKATERACKLSMDANKTAGRAFLVDTDEDGDPDITDPDDDGDGTADATDVDDDNDGLIEVHNLDMFDHIRHNLAGTSYKTGASIADNRTGAPEAETDDCKTATVDGGKNFYLCGYELMRDLDFAEGASYASISVNDAWRPNDQADASGSAATPDNALNPGFVGAAGFAGIFEGNGYTISNLYSRNTASSNKSIGLFATTTAAAAIRSLGVVNAHLYGNTAVDRIGSLVGQNYGRLIMASYATGGTINGGGGDDVVGGLVGYNNDNSIIIASHATGDVDGDADIGSEDDVGGLVGTNDTGSIIASYATGNVAGGTRMGGLVGESYKGSIIASYATGTVNGSTENDNVGGLVGWNNSSIVASYATGNVNGGGGDDAVGGLAGYNGYNGGNIVASYATGDVDGGDGANDNVGTLVGQNVSNITHSYAFGTPTNVDTPGDAGIAHPTGLSGSGAAKANTLTDPAGVETTDADDVWDDASEKTKGAWDFGTNSQRPALKYADYDGAGDTYSCDMFPAKIPGTDTTLVCGTSLLPKQRR